MSSEIELIKEWIESLKTSTAAIVVEGKNDKKALVHFGVDGGRVFWINKPLFAIVEEVASEYESVVILTDLDKKGKEIYDKLSRDFKKHGISIDDSFREFLFKETQLRQIEGLIRYVERLSAK